jgi:hypothetical protein
MSLFLIREIAFPSVEMIHTRGSTGIVQGIINFSSFDGATLTPSISSINLMAPLSEPAIVSMAPVSVLGLVSLSSLYPG